MLFKIIRIVMENYSFHNNHFNIWILNSHTCPAILRFFPVVQSEYHAFIMTIVINFKWSIDFLIAYATSCSESLLWNLSQRRINIYFPHNHYTFTLYINWQSFDCKRLTWLMKRYCFNLPYIFIFFIYYTLFFSNEYVRWFYESGRYEYSGVAGERLTVHSL